MRTEGPLFCRVETANGRYIYDAATNRLFAVSPYLFDHIDELVRMSADDVARRCEETGDGATFRSAWETVQRQRREANCLPCALPDIGLSLSPAQIESVALHHSRIIAFEVTSRCNLRCRYCVFSGGYPNTRPHGSRRMSMQTALKGVELAYRVTDHLGGGEAVGIVFTGGEPFLNWPVIRETMEYVRAKDWGGRQVSFNTTTNATLFTREHLEFLSAHHVNLTISLDGPREVHDRCRVFPNGVRSTFDQVMAAVRLIRAERPEYFDQHVMFSAVLSYPVDWASLDRFFREEMGLPSGKLMLAQVRDGNEIYFTDSRVAAREHTGYEELERRFLRAATNGCLFGNFTPDAAEQEMKAEGNTCVSFIPMVTAMLHLDRRSVSAEGWPKGPLQPRGCCIAPARRLLIATDGALYPCDRIYFNDFTRIGDVDAGIDLEKVVRMHREFYELTADECRRCWAVRLCSQCWTGAIGKGSFDREAKLSRCPGIRADLKRRLTVYCGVRERRPDAFDHRGEVSFG